MRPLARWRSTNSRPFKATTIGFRVTSPCAPHNLSSLVGGSQYKIVAANHQLSQRQPPFSLSLSESPFSSSSSSTRKMSGTHHSNDSDVQVAHSSWRPPAIHIEDTEANINDEPPISSTDSEVEPENAVVDFTFIEEPLGLTEEQTYGFPQLEFGQRIGPFTHPASSESESEERRYKIVRKLGFGRNSSVWLAYDERYCIFILRRESRILTLKNKHTE